MSIILKQFIIEIIKNSLREINLPKFEDPTELYLWAKSNLKQIGWGGSRGAFEIDSDKVLKIAMYEDSIEKNKIELEAFKCLTREFAPQVYSYDNENYHWMIVEKVESLAGKDSKYEKILYSLLKINPIEFPNIQTTFPDLLKIAIFHNDKEWANKKLMPLANSEWFKKIVIALKSCDVSYMDFFAKNCGLGTDGRLVLIDADMRLSEYN